MFFLTQKNIEFYDYEAFRGSDFARKTPRNTSQSQNPQKSRFFRKKRVFGLPYQNKQAVFRSFWCGKTGWKSEKWAFSTIKWHGKRHKKGFFDEFLKGGGVKNRLFSTFLGKITGFLPKKALFTGFLPHLFEKMSFFADFTVFLLRESAIFTKNSKKVDFLQNSWFGSKKSKKMVKKWSKNGRFWSIFAKNPVFWPFLHSFKVTSFRWEKSPGFDRDPLFLGIFLDHFLGCLRVF